MDAKLLPPQNLTDTLHPLFPSFSLEQIFCRGESLFPLAQGFVPLGKQVQTFAEQGFQLSTGTMGPLSGLFLQQ